VRAKTDLACRGKNEVAREKLRGRAIGGTAIRLSDNKEREDSGFDHILKGKKTLKRKGPEKEDDMGRQANRGALIFEPFCCRKK